MLFLLSMPKPVFVSYIIFRSTPQADIRTSAVTLIPWTAGVAAVKVAAALPRPAVPLCAGPLPSAAPGPRPPPPVSRRTTMTRIRTPSPGTPNTSALTVSLWRTSLETSLATWTTISAGLWTSLAAELAAAEAAAAGLATPPQRQPGPGKVRYAG